MVISGLVMPQAEAVRVAVVSESDLAHTNGVTNSVLRVEEELQRAGHQTLIIAPESEGGTPALGETTLSVAIPSYPQVRLGLARSARLEAILADFGAEVVHLASPFVLGWQALAAARHLKLPTVAVYQTDMRAYAQRYGWAGASALVDAHLRRLHGRATVNLVPSQHSLHQLEELGVPEVHLWRRGVDLARFNPQRRSEQFRQRLGAGKLIVGYVGRLAPEKQVEDLRVLSDLPGVQVVVVGDGPSRPGLEKLLDQAHFTGRLGGLELAEAVASFDVFVHTGESETFGQTIQEAHASGVPVVATGVGGPVDLVRSSFDGWLYRPGDLADLRRRVADLVGDNAKRRAFAQAAWHGVQGRSWAALTAELVEHYHAAIARQRAATASSAG
jgi:phosphatidylinositol alpha 1,6-mannosyltransferase